MNNKFRIGDEIVTSLDSNTYGVTNCDAEMVVTRLLSDIFIAVRVTAHKNPLYVTPMEWPVIEKDFELKGKSNKKESNMNKVIDKFFMEGLRVNTIFGYGGTIMSYDAYSPDAQCWEVTIGLDEGGISSILEYQIVGYVSPQTSRVMASESYSAVKDKPAVGPQKGWVSEPTKEVILHLDSTPGSTIDTSVLNKRVKKIPRLRTDK